MAKLLPCPFCGAYPSVLKGHHAFEDVMIRCEECGVDGPLFDRDGAEIAENEREAIAHWNKRVK